MPEPLALPAKKRRRLWDQRPDENADDYALFLNYRNCGPGRSLRRAVREFSKQFPNSHYATECNISGKLVDVVVPRRWFNVYKQFDWEARAVAFDVSTMKLIGARLVINQGRCLRKLHARALAAIDKLDLKNARDVVEILKLVQSYLSPEVVAPIVASQGYAPDLEDSPLEPVAA